MESSPTAPPAAAYRPHLDGLRAVAVYLVVLFHAGVGAFAGGYIGVDVFFVLSGYLVTQLLLRDLVAMGTIRLRRFYARRFRRLLPAAFLALIASAAMYAAVASPGDVFAAKGGYQAAFLYYTNWFLVGRATAYFGGEIAKTPVLHFWSLAVEEQFYLLWPLLLGGLFATTRRLRAKQYMTIRAVLGIGAVASLGWALLLEGPNPNHAYYGTDARAYQLLAGASLALAPGWIAGLARFPRVAHGLAAASLVALVALASRWVGAGAIGRGGWVTLATCVLLLSSEGAEGGLVRRLLSTPLSVYLGRVSYGTYLWHWIVIIVVTRVLALGPWGVAGVGVVLATGLASLSFQLCERPVRESRTLDGHAGTVIATGLSLSVVSATVLIPLILMSGAGALSGETDAAVGFTPIPPGLDFADAGYQSLPQFPVCLGKDPEECIVIHGTGTHVLLMGDSHARMLLPTFIEIARREHLTLSASILGGCPWQRALYTAMVPDLCQERKEDAYTRVIPALNPDVIVLVNFGYDDPMAPPFPVSGPDRAPLKRGVPEFDHLMIEATRRSIAELRVGSRKLVIVEPIPRANIDPTECLKTSKVLQACRYVAGTQPSVLEREYREIASRTPGVLSADFDRLVCPYLPICDPVIAGHIVKIDAQHITLEFAQYISTDVDVYLKANGLIPQGGLP